MYISVICPVKCVREIEHNGEDAIATQNLFKLKDGLQFERLWKQEHGTQSPTHACSCLKRLL